MPISHKDLFIFDLDGVIYKINKPINTGIIYVRHLLKIGKKVAFYTNNSSKTPEIFQKKLSTMGIQVDSSSIFTSATISAKFLAKQYPHAIMYIVGEEGLRDIMKQHRFHVLNEENPKIENYSSIPPDIHADLVIIGWDTKLTYNKMRTAMMLINKGAKFYATNDDASFPAPDALWPGAGANVAFLSRALGKSPEKIFGKPHPDGILAILEHYHISAENAVLIGDRLSTDILGGNNSGLTTVLVETGVHSKFDIEKYPSTYQPNIIVEDLTDLINKK
ncbi:MAG: HAD-IIA family hydrolase [Promethearchaeota archaeon]